MSARSALHMASMLGIAASPNMLARAEDEQLAEDQGCTVRELYHPRKPKPYDHEAAARLRAERIERKKANYRRRYNLDE